MKTRKTLLKRIRITKTGKIMAKQNNTGHLKRKWTASKRNRKNTVASITTSGYIKRIKTMMGKHGRKIALKKAQ